MALLFGSLVILAGVCVLGILLWRALKREAGIRGLYGILEGAIETSRYGFMFFDAQGRLVRANDQARHYLPLLSSQTPAPVILNEVLDFIYDMAVEYTDDSIRNMMNRTAQHMKHNCFREVIYTLEGRLVLVEAYESGGATILTLLDVSKIRLYEEEVMNLHTANYQLHQAVDVATNGIMVVRLEEGAEKLVFANHAFCEMVRLCRQAVCGSTIEAVLLALQDPEMVERIQVHIQGRDSVDVAVCFEQPEGPPRHYALKLTPVSQERRQEKLVIGVFTDMTALKQKEAERFKAQKLEALGHLAAGVAHDFNNVLSIIDGYARMAGKNMPSDAPEQEYLERVHQASKRGSSLVNQMLTFSRHKIVVETVIDLAQVVREQETLLAPLLDASIKYMVFCENADAFVECQADSIVRILMNLVVNARDAMPHGGRLLVEVRKIPRTALPVASQGLPRDAEYACLSVSDSGMGMPQHVIEQIFDPFYTTKSQGKGTGLGLSMVYGLVKQMDGMIDVHSVEGQGTMMRVFLPLTERKPNKRVSGDARDVGHIRFDGYTVLVAEDEPDLLFLVSGMLEKLGMHVLQATHGNEALAVQDAYEGKIDLLLTDVVMPELNGVALAELVQEVREDIAVIFMSGYPARGDMARVSIPESSYFMAKPVEYGALALLIYERLQGQKRPVAEGPFFRGGIWENQREIMLKE